MSRPVRPEPASGRARARRQSGTFDAMLDAAGRPAPRAAPGRPARPSVRNDARAEATNGNAAPDPATPDPRTATAPPADPAKLGECRQPCAQARNGQLSDTDEPAATGRHRGRSRSRPQRSTRLPPPSMRRRRRRSVTRLRPAAKRPSARSRREAGSEDGDDAPRLSRDANSDRDVAAGRGCGRQCRLSATPTPTSAADGRSTPALAPAAAPAQPHPADPATAEAAAAPVRDAGRRARTKPRAKAARQRQADVARRNEAAADAPKRR